MRSSGFAHTLFAVGIGAALVASACAPAAAPATAPQAPRPQTAPPPPAAPAAAAPAQPAAPAAPQAAATPRPAAATPQPAASPTPVGTRVKKGGILRQVNPAAPGDLDLIAASSLITLVPLGLNYDGLVKEDPLKPGQVAPDLAERWSLSSDGTRITFALRKGVTFHNGRPFTATDAQHSVKRWMTDNEQLAPALSAVIKSVEVADANTLVLNLKFPYPDLFKNFMLDWASVVPADQPTGSNIKEVIGTGPFKFKRFQSGVSYEVVRNDKYWNRDAPHLDGVTVYVIPDQNTGFAALRAGRVDITAPNYITAQQSKLLDSQMKGEATAYLYANGNWRTIYMPNGKKPWSDARVRRAIFIAIDRKQALETVDKGLGSVGGVLPPSMGGLTPDELKTTPGWREPKSVDIAEAKKLLTEAGFPKGFKTDIFYRSGGDYLSMATFLKDQLAPLGIDATLSTRAGAAFYDYSYARSYDLFAHRHPWAPASPDAILAQYYRSGGARNFSDVADPKLDAMIDRQMSTLDWQERKKQLRAIETYLYDNAFASISHWGSYPQAWRKWVRDFFPGETILSNVRMEAVWLDR